MHVNMQFYVCVYVCAILSNASPPVKEVSFSFESYVFLSGSLLDDFGLSLIGVLEIGMSVRGTLTTGRLVVGLQFAKNILAVVVLVRRVFPICQHL